MKNRSTKRCTTVRCLRVKKNNVAHDLPAAPCPPLPKAWSDNKISISTFSKSQWMGSLKRLKAPRHTLHKLSDRWLRLTSLIDLQHSHVNERSITWDSLWTEKEQITFASDGSNQANGQKMVANGAPLRLVEPAAVLLAVHQPGAHSQHRHERRRRRTLLLASGGGPR